jgi:hypothetical protein
MKRSGSYRVHGFLKLMWPPRLPLLRKGPPTTKRDMTISVALVLDNYPNVDWKIYGTGEGNGRLVIWSPPTRIVASAAMDLLPEYRPEDIKCQVFQLLAELGTRVRHETFGYDGPSTDPLKEVFNAKKYILS